MKRIFWEIELIRRQLSFKTEKIDEHLDNIANAVPLGKHLSDMEGRCSARGCFSTNEEGEKRCDYFEANPPSDFPQPTCYNCCNGFCSIKYLRRES